MTAVRYVCFAAALIAASSCFCSDEDEISKAYQFQRQGALKPARVIYESLLARPSSQLDSPLFVNAVRRLSEVDLAEGKYSAAIQHASECVSRSRKLALGAVEVDCLSITARAQVASGDYPAALQTEERALKISDGNHSAEDQIAVLNNLGGINFFLGRYGEAYRCYRDAESRLSSHEREKWYARRRQLTLANLATLYQRLGQYQRALDTYGQLRTAPGAMLAGEQAQMLANMGTLYRRLGDPVKAIRTYRSAQALFATGKNLDGEIGVIKNTGIALALDLGDLSQAGGLFQRALKMAQQSGDRRESVQAHLYMGETLWRLQDSEGAGRHFKLALLGAKEIRSAEDEWKALYGLGRLAANAGERDQAVELYGSALAVIETLRSGMATGALRTGFLADKRDVYDAAIGLLIEYPNPPLDRILRTIEGAKARTFQDLTKKTRAGGPSVASVSAKLDASTLLLDFWIGHGHAAVVWISPAGSGISPLDAPSDSELEAFVRYLKSGTGAQWRELSAKIGTQLLAHITLQLSAAKQVIIVPDGPLQRIPFEALAMSAQAGAPLLVEQAAVSYLPSVSALTSGDAGATRSWISPWRRELIAFADPRLGDASGKDSLLDNRVASLPASAEEVRSIASILGGMAEIHTGGDDLKRYFESSHLRGVPLIHLSTHAVADSGDAGRSRLVFSPNGSGQAADYLFAREISGLDLSGVLIVTLAACDTEGGEATAGEGVQSFSRAFLEAGAASVITALWPVGDQSTSEFMKQFYGRLAKGERASDALRDAKLAFLRAGSSAGQPRYWAAFVLNGNARTKAPFTTRWLALSMAGVVALGLAVLYFKRRD